MQLFRVSVKTKETDKRKNATVFHHIVAADTLADAKDLAVAKWVDPPEYEYKTHTLDKIASVVGYAMGTLVLSADVRGSKDHSEQLETVPTAERIAVVRDMLATFEATHNDDEDDAAWAKGVASFEAAVAKQAAHEAADPHCTCNKCIVSHAQRLANETV